MQTFRLSETREFRDTGLKKFLVHDSYNFRIINFNLKAGQELPVHNHDLDGELSILVLEGEGEFLGGGLDTIPARPGDVLLSQVREPHGVRAKTDMRILVHIAPPV